MKNKLYKNLIRVTFFLLIGICINNSYAASLASQKYFFEQNAHQINLTPGQIVLHHVDNHVLWFAEAPSQQSGFMSLNQYMQFWSKQGSFKYTNPNATLVGFVVNNKTHQLQRLTLVLTLRHAVVNPKLHTLTYTVNKMMSVPNHKAVQHAVILYYPSLFIDPGIIQPGHYPSA